MRSIESQKRGFFWAMTTNPPIPVGTFNSCAQLYSKLVPWKEDFAASYDRLYQSLITFFPELELLTHDRCTFKVGSEDDGQDDDDEEEGAYEDDDDDSGDDEDSVMFANECQVPPI